MKRTNKKLVAGILAGAMLTGIGVNAASAKAASHTGKHQRPVAMQRGQMPQHPPVQMSSEEAAQKIHDTFGVDAKEVKSAIDEGKDVRDVGQAAMFANISGKSFKDVLEMKTDEKNWQEVGKELGITPEQVREQMMTMQAVHIEQKANVEKNTALALLKNGYQPRDVEAAGVLAKAANKDIQAVLDMKKINNSWFDVADQLGVDKNVLKAEIAPRFDGQPAPEQPAPEQPVK